jgi:glycerol-3-phosphate dehydrogenase (NAD(P)+)
MRITILGAGNMGCALATVIASNRHDVVLWSIEQDVVADIARHHRSEKYLPGIRFTRRITATCNLVTALQRARGVIVAVPSHVVARVAEQAAPYITPRLPVLSVAKGIDPTTLQPISDTIATALRRAKGSVAGLGGPAIATEFSRGTPTAVVVAGRVADTKFWRRVLERPTFHTEESRDLVGVSWTAALKNVYAIALGMCDGMRYTMNPVAPPSRPLRKSIMKGGAVSRFPAPTTGAPCEWRYGMNTKAILMTRAIGEMATLLRSVQSASATTYGLAGLGDLVTTGFSPHGRNRSFGELICAGAQCDIPAVLKTMTVEGISAVAVAHTWAQRKHLRLPLLELVWKVCHRGADPCRSLQRYLRAPFIIQQH